MADSGYKTLQTPEAFRNFLGSLGYGNAKNRLRQLSPAQIARILVVLGNSRPPASDTDRNPAALLPSSALEWIRDYLRGNELPMPLVGARFDTFTQGDWSAEVVSEVLRVDHPEDSSKIISALDFRDCNLSSDRCFEFIVNVVSLFNPVDPTDSSTKFTHGFPTQFLLKETWKNWRAQLCAVRHAIEAKPTLLTFHPTFVPPAHGRTAQTPYRVLHPLSFQSSGALPTLPGSISQAWLSPDLYATLISLAEAGGSDSMVEISVMLDDLSRVMPDLVLMGLAFTMMKDLRQELFIHDPLEFRSELFSRLFSQLLGPILSGSATASVSDRKNASLMLERLWNVSPQVLILTLFYLKLREQAPVVARTPQALMGLQAVRKAVGFVLETVSKLRHFAYFACTLPLRKEAFLFALALAAPSPQLAEDIAQFGELKVLAEPFPFGLSGSSGGAKEKLDVGAWFSHMLLLRQNHGLQQPQPFTQFAVPQALAPVVLPVVEPSFLSSFGTIIAVFTTALYQLAVQNQAPSLLASQQDAALKQLDLRSSRPLDLQGLLKRHISPTESSWWEQNCGFSLSAVASLLLQANSLEMYLPISMNSYMQYSLSLLHWLQRSPPQTPLGVREEKVLELVRRRVVPPLDSFASLVEAHNATKALQVQAQAQAQLSSQPQLQAQIQTSLEGLKKLLQLMQDLGVHLRLVQSDSDAETLGELFGLTLARPPQELRAIVEELVRMLNNQLPLLNHSILLFPPYQPLLRLSPALQQLHPQQQVHPQQLLTLAISQLTPSQASAFALAAIKSGTNQLLKEPVVSQPLLSSGLLKNTIPQFIELLQLALAQPALVQAQSSLVSSQAANPAALSGSNQFPLLKMAQPFGNQAVAVPGAVTGAVGSSGAHNVGANSYTPTSEELSKLATLSLPVSTYQASSSTTATNTTSSADSAELKVPTFLKNIAHNAGLPSNWVVSSHISSTLLAMRAKTSPTGGAVETPSAQQSTYLQIAQQGPEFSLALSLLSLKKEVPQSVVTGEDTDDSAEQGSGSGQSVNTNASTNGSNPSFAAIVERGLATRMVPESEPPAPVQRTQDLVNMALNNISEQNLQQRIDQLAPLMQQQEKGAPATLTAAGVWFAHALMKRISQYPNLRNLLFSFIVGFKQPRLYERVLLECTSQALRVLVTTHTKSTSTSTTINALGNFIGLMTLAQNKPLLHSHLCVKNLLLFAYDTGHLFCVVPFVKELMNHARESSVFRAPNPWTVGVLALLKEIRQLPRLKLTIRFDIDPMLSPLLSWWGPPGVPPSPELLVQLNEDAYIEQSTLLVGRPKPSGSLELDYTEAPDGGRVQQSESAAAARGTQAEASAAIQKLLGQQFVIPNLRALISARALNRLLDASAEASSEHSMDVNELSGAFSSMVSIAVEATLKEFLIRIDHFCHLSLSSTLSLVGRDFDADTDLRRALAAARIAAASLASGSAAAFLSAASRESLRKQFELVFQSNAAVLRASPGFSPAIAPALQEQCVLENAVVVLAVIEKVAIDRTLCSLDLIFQELQALGGQKPLAALVGVSGLSEGARAAVEIAGRASEAKRRLSTQYKHVNGIQQLLHGPFASASSSTSGSNEDGLDLGVYSAMAVPRLPLAVESLDAPVQALFEKIRLDALQAVQSIQAAKQWPANAPLTAESFQIFRDSPLLASVREIFKSLNKLPDHVRFLFMSTVMKYALELCSHLLQVPYANPGFHLTLLPYFVGLPILAALKFIIVRAGAQARRSPFAEHVIQYALQSKKTEKLIGLLFRHGILELGEIDQFFTLAIKDKKASHTILEALHDDINFGDLPGLSSLLNVTRPNAQPLTLEQRNLYLATNQKFIYLIMSEFSAAQAGLSQAQVQAQGQAQVLTAGMLQGQNSGGAGSTAPGSAWGAGVAANTTAGLHLGSVGVVGGGTGVQYEQKLDQMRKVVETWSKIMELVATSGAQSLEARLPNYFLQIERQFPQDGEISMLLLDLGHFHFNLILKKIGEVEPALRETYKQQLLGSMESIISLLVCRSRIVVDVVNAPQDQKKLTLVPSQPSGVFSKLSKVLVTQVFHYIEKMTQLAAGQAQGQAQGSVAGSGASASALSSLDFRFFVKIIMGFFRDQLGQPEYLRALFPSLPTALSVADRESTLTLFSQFLVLLNPTRSAAFSASWLELLGAPFYIPELAALARANHAGNPNGVEKLYPFFQKVLYLALYFVRPMLLRQKLQAGSTNLLTSASLPALLAPAGPAPGAPGTGAGFSQFFRVLWQLIREVTIELPSFTADYAPSLLSLIPFAKNDLRNSILAAVPPGVRPAVPGVLLEAGQRFCAEVGLRAPAAALALAPAVVPTPAALPECAIVPRAILPFISQNSADSSNPNAPASAAAAGGAEDSLIGQRMALLRQEIERSSAGSPSEGAFSLNRLVDAIKNCMVPSVEEEVTQAMATDSPAQLANGQVSVGAGAGHTHNLNAGPIVHATAAVVMVTYIVNASLSSILTHVPAQAGAAPATPRPAPTTGGSSATAAALGSAVAAINGNSAVGLQLVPPPNGVLFNIPGGALVNVDMVPVVACGEYVTALMSVLLASDEVVISAVVDALSSLLRYPNAHSLFVVALFRHVFNMTGGSAFSSSPAVHGVVNGSDNNVKITFLREHIVRSLFDRCVDPSMLSWGVLYSIQSLSSSDVFKILREKEMKKRKELVSFVDNIISIGNADGNF